MWGCRGAGQEPPPGPTPPGPLPLGLEPPLGRKREAKGRGHEPRDFKVKKEPQLLPKGEETGPRKTLGFCPFLAKGETGGRLWGLEDCPKKGIVRSTQSKDLGIPVVIPADPTPPPLWVRRSAFPEGRPHLTCSRAEQLQKQPDEEVSLPHLP